MDPSDNKSPEAANAAPQQPTPVTPATPTQTTPTFGGTPPTNTPVTGGSGSPSGFKKLLSNKKMLPVVIAATVAVLVLGTAGAYFGIVVPNQPENLWPRALKNSGKGLDKLVEYAEKNKDTKGAEVKGTFKIDAGEFVTDGSFEGQSYENDSKFKADFGLGTGRVNLEALTLNAPNSKNPDVYLKATGIKDFGALLGPEFGEQLSSLENQWFVVDHTLLDNMEKQAAEGQASTEDFKPEDGIAITKAVAEVNREYIFTDNKSKAVLVVKQQVGKEKLDDRNVYHYIVGVNKENAKAYATAMKDRLKQTKLKDLVGGESFEETIGFDEIIKELDNIKDDDTADAWVDMKTKLLRKVRFTEKENRDNYLDIGLNYNGGDEYPFYISGQTKEDGENYTYKVEVKVNTKTRVTDLGFNLDGTMSGSKMSAKVNAAITATDKKVDVKKPDNAKSVNELLGLFLGGGLGAPTQPEPDAYDLDSDFGDFDF
jgi:hypothetical protein